MSRNRGTLLTCCVLAAAPLFAQPPNDDCGSAALLCAQQAVAGDNTGATGWPGFCPGTANVLWYTFTTNSQGGTVDITVSGIDCPAVAGMDNELSVVVLSGDGSCLPGSFTAASVCLQDSNDFTLTTPALPASTQYWVIVAGVANNGAVIPAQCDFTIMSGGPGADIVNVDLDAGPDVQIAEGESVQLNATGCTTCDWSPSSGLSGDQIPDPIASPTETTTYTLTADVNGCTYEDYVLVEVRRLINPSNTITPNGDGINDTWEISGIGDYPSCEVVIYDRWGQKVFNDTGYRTPFDGTRNGKELPVATYYWYIDLKQLKGRSAPYTGSLTIIR
jgi:gliding motility-associated-like protein